MPVSPVFSSNDNHLESGPRMPTADHTSSCILDRSTFSKHALKDPVKLDLLSIITDAPVCLLALVLIPQQYNEPNRKSWIIRGQQLILLRSRKQSFLELIPLEMVSHLISTTYHYYKYVGMLMKCHQWGRKGQITVQLPAQNQLSKFSY